MPLPSRPTVLSISPASASQVKRADDDAPGNDESRKPAHDQSLPRWPQTLLAIMLAVIIVAALAIATLLAVAQARDRYWINIASGSWVALAWHADHGVLYPPLRDADGNFGGTRYMPLHVLAHSGLARATGEYLQSGRIIGYTSACLWFAGVIVLARQRGCPRLFACALAASVLASPTGIQALCTIRSDGLALALQLWALWIIGRNDRPSGAGFAAVLCALGFLAKLTAVWAAVGIGLWLLWRNRASLVVFVLTGLIVAGASIAVINYVMTDGRFLENMLHSSTTGWRGWGSVLTWSQQRMLQFVSEWSPTTWVLVPPATLAILLAAAKRDLNVVHLAWVACCATMAVMFADAGVGENHIVELAAITAVCAGDLWKRAGEFSEPPSTVRWSVAQLMLAIALGWSSQAVIKHGLWLDIERAFGALKTGRPAPDDDARALETTLDGKRFLSDDPTLAILRNRKPVVSDAFMFRGFEQSHPEWTDELVARIDNREFDVIALTHLANPDSWWYHELFLGPRVTKAIADNYRLDRNEAAFYIYMPKQ